MHLTVCQTQLITYKINYNIHFAALQNVMIQRCARIFFFWSFQSHTVQMIQMTKTVPVFTGSFLNWRPRVNLNPSLSYSHLPLGAHTSFFMAEDQKLSWQPKAFEWIGRSQIMYLRCIYFKLWISFILHGFFFSHAWHLGT